MASFVHAVVTVSSAGTAVQFSAAPLKVKSILIQAPQGNSGVVYIGNSTVSSSNTPSLSAGDCYEIDFKKEPSDTPGELSDIYADAATSGDTVRYLAVTL